MSELPYTNLPGKIPKYFEKIQEAGLPPSKVDNKWLKQCGFASSNDRYILNVLEFIGFIDEAKSHTELWKKYKSSADARSVLAQAIRTGYSDLFSLYPDANRKDRDTLYAFFSSKTGKAKNTVELMVTTFMNLCELADFEAEATKPIPEPVVQPSLSPPLTPPTVRLVSEKGIVTEIHINIQLHLPPATDPTVFDNLFKSMKKHLLSAE